MKNLFKTMVLLILILILGCSKSKEEKKTDPKQPSKVQVAPEEGYYAPGFQLTDLKGQKVSLSDYKGKVVLVNFWATWCGFCRKELPSMESLYQMLKPRGFEILAINVDRLSVQEVSSFILKNQMNFPVLLNPLGDVAKQYHVSGLPVSFLVDQKGIIRWKVVGARDWMEEKIIEKIETLLPPAT
jgi:cytochrome c biogenesis protein CcmG/thiol:disulfide interchange protein DsbE